MSASKHLEPIKAIATYELVANQIQRAVHLGLLVPGDRLPAERALAQQLGVARMTVREAIRVLAHEGRITVRRGAHGGMWIRAQDVTKRELLQLAADTDRAIGDVYEFRELVEGASARLAAERAKPDDVRKLRSLSSSMEKILAAHLKNPAISVNVSRFLATRLPVPQRNSPDLRQSLRHRSRRARVGGPLCALRRAAAHPDSSRQQRTRGAGGGDRSWGRRPSREADALPCGDGAQHYHCPS